MEAPIIGRILIGDTKKGRNNPVFLSCDFLIMVPPENLFLSLRLPIFGASYYIFGGKEGRKEGSTKLGLCATLLAPSSIDAWRTTWGVSI